MDEIIVIALARDNNGTLNRVKYPYCPLLILLLWSIATLATST